MGLAARFGEPHLFLTLAQGAELFVRKRAMAARAGDAVFEMRVRAIIGADWVATGMAKLIIANLQPMPDADALIKDKAFTFPEAVFARHGFQVFQDPALQVEDIFDAK